MSLKRDFLFMVLLVGSEGSGKSYLQKRFVRNFFSLELHPTTGMHHAIKNIEVYEKNVQIQIWDPPGREEFKPALASYIQRFQSILLVYDITDKSSFEEISNWYSFVASNRNLENLSFFLIGTKSDLKSSRKVSFDEGQELANKLGMYFMEISGNNRHNLDTLFKFMCGILVSQKIENISAKIQMKLLKRQKRKNTSWF
ncbi:unnamed protein product [Blepharisma stoltei]|uniref:GTP-binding protein n=1 Tax=Blepharisma stoltei TaxID=1481888 RepID=A0AAU9IQT8_9CILI|nr:unnamed protein product [Blepharisma stoltei]